MKNKLDWRDKKDKLISCDEKLKVLNENFDEIKNVAQNAYDDAILMGCSENDFKSKLILLIREMKFSYK
ncbi:MAG: hypothetical protein CMM96_02405 [Rickettsiales bacterium]|nr:hypothetical protein [Rickettsiales bacterium]|tara:strand:- start:559 stop:765 length:207 start_codon:yes stop_codon:yes gene_type:complete